MQLTFPTGTPLATTNAAIADLTQQIAQIPDVERQTGTAGSYQAGFGGGITQGSVGQIHVFLKGKRQHTTNYWATALTAMARKKYARGNPVAIPATGTGGGNSQPIDYNITSDNDDPNPYANKILAVLESTPGIVHAVSNASILAPQVDVVFDRERARALDVDIASAANGIRAAFGGSTAAQFFTNLGVKYVQVTYPQSAQSSVDEINRIPVRTKTGHSHLRGDVSRLGARSEHAAHHAHEPPDRHPRQRKHHAGNCALERAARVSAARRRRCICRTPCTSSRTLAASSRTSRTRSAVWAWR